MSGSFIEDDFEQFTKSMKPGRAVPQVLRYRQGGHARSWAQPGSTSYVPHSAFLMAGSVAWSGVAAVSGNLTFAFKNKFSETPLVLVTVANTTPLFEGVWLQASSDGPGMEIYWWSTNPVSLIWFHWLAIGPGAA